MIPENLVDITREMLRARPAYMTLAHIAAEIEESPSWLRKFIERKGMDPGARKVVKLYNFLLSVRQNEQF